MLSGDESDENEEENPFDAIKRVGKSVNFGDIIACSAEWLHRRVSLGSRFEKNSMALSSDMY